jgi:peptidoglycan/LPS O-acetylase OafA/YrhL
MTGLALPPAAGIATPLASAAFWSHWAWPLATAVLGFIFFGLVLAQRLRRRRAHQLAWSVGLLMYAMAAAMEAWSEGQGEWSPNVYRVYIVLAASLVGFLGLGSLYLLARRRLWGHLYLAFLLVCLIVFFVGVFTTSLDADKLVPGITVGGQALGPSMSFPRVMSLPFNITGSVFLIGGALVSIWRFARRREYAYRVWANVLIAVGAGLIAFVGSRARLGDTTGLYPGEMVASALMLAGFLMAGTLDRGTRARREARAAGG